MATMNISLPDKLKKWVEKQVKAGSYSNSSDFMREMLRKEKDRREAINDLQTLIDEGDASGYEDVDLDALEAELRRRTSAQHAA
jgi:antitoxin ParD1/3/4